MRRVLAAVSPAKNAFLLQGQRWRVFGRRRLICADLAEHPSLLVILLQKRLMVFVFDQLHPLVVARTERRELCVHVVQLRREALVLALQVIIVAFEQFYLHFGVLYVLLELYQRFPLIFAPLFDGCGKFLG